MAFIDRMIGNDETIIARTRPHWIYIMQGFLLLVTILVFGHILDHEIKDYIRQELFYKRESDWLLLLYTSRSYIFLFCVAVAVLVFLYHLVFYRSTHIALTSDRLIYKTGMFFVDVHETNLDEIKGEQVHNGFFGRVLNYGFVEIDCRFVKNMNLPAIEGPYAFLHNLHKAVRKIEDTPLEQYIGR